MHLDIFYLCHTMQLSQSNFYFLKQPPPCLENVSSKLG